jgi:predicted nucleotidyltransferase
MNSDWVDLLRELKSAEVRFLLVGAHAVGVYGVPRATRDIDVWVEPSQENADRVILALSRFGAPLSAIGVGRADFESPDRVVQIGEPPNRINLMTSLSGLADFASAWNNRTSAQMGGVPVDAIGLEELLANKRASGRDKDLVDIRELGRFRKPSAPLSSDSDRVDLLPLNRLASEALFRAARPGDPRSGRRSNNPRCNADDQSARQAEPPCRHQEGQGAGSEAEPVQAWGVHACVHDHPQEAELRAP